MSLLRENKVPRHDVFFLLDWVADAHFKQEGEGMGANHDELVKKSTAEGKKLAKEHEATFQSDNRKAQNYSRWLNDQGNSTVTSKPKKA